MARSFHPRRRPGTHRKWVTVDDTAAVHGQDEPRTAPEETLQDEPDGATGPATRRYPWQDDPDYDPTAHLPPPRPEAPPSEPPPAPERPAAGEAGEQASGQGPGPEEGAPRRGPRQVTPPKKLTVTRVAAMRSRELTGRAVHLFHGAAGADGADRSGLRALTYATMMDYAIDAAVAVALANTLFFAAATAESKTNVALYLLITVAPFAVVAPVIGPMLDKLQRGRRAALAISCAGRAVLAVVMALNYDNWILYPAALGTMVLSKSFIVLKAAITPRVLPEKITLATTNSRLTVFGLIAGGVFGGIGAGIAALFDSPGALYYTALLGIAGTVLCLRIPKWVEVTVGEVPAALRSTRRRPMSRWVVMALWGNSGTRALTGFLTLFVAFVVKQQAETDPTRQLLLIGIVGAAGGAGSFIGNGIGSRMRFRRADIVLVSCVAVACAAAILAAVLPSIATAAAAALIGATASAMAKVCLDAVIQRDMPEDSRASAFGRSETVLQLAWVFGGALGVLLPHSTFWIGFTVIASVLAVLWLQTLLVSRGRSLVPGLGNRAPLPRPSRGPVGAHP